LYVWLVLITIRIWGTIRFFLRASYSSYDHVTQYVKEADDVLVYFQAAGDPSQAFCNAILFCVMDKEVRRNLVRMCKREEKATDVRDNISEQKPLITDEQKYFLGPTCVLYDSDVFNSDNKSRSMELSSKSNFAISKSESFRNSIC